MKKYLLPWFLILMCVLSPASGFADDDDGTGVEHADDASSGHKGEPPE